MNHRILFRLSFVLLLTLTFGCANTQNRTVDAAQARFDRGEFRKGETTQEQVRGRFGSPSAVTQTQGGGETWTYSKVVEINPLIPAYDRGTNYIAEYLFDEKGVMVGANYRATPMGNPLLK